jgi:hypothetical protein
MVATKPCGKTRLSTPALPHASGVSGAGRFHRCHLPNAHGGVHHCLCGQAYTDDRVDRAERRALARGSGAS